MTDPLVSGANTAGLLSPQPPAPPKRSVRRDKEDRHTSQPSLLPYALPVPAVDPPRDTHGNSASHYAATYYGACDETAYGVPETWRLHLALPLRSGSCDALRCTPIRSGW